MKSYLVKIEHEFKVISRRRCKKEYPNQIAVVEVNVELTNEEIEQNDTMEEDELAINKAIIKLLDERIINIGESIHVKDALCLCENK